MGERSVNSLKKRYQDLVVSSLIKEFSFKNRMQVPAVQKIVLNVALGTTISTGKVLDATMQELELIAGQKPVVTKAKKSIAGFKLRKGVSLGCKVTLRKSRMYDFMDRLFHVALPRIRDFRGFSPKAFDGHGNYSLGIKEQLIFPEINYDDVSLVHGMNITFVTTAGNDSEGKALLMNLGFPFRGDKGEIIG